MNTTNYSRKISAILSTDIVGYSRLMGEDEEATVHALTGFRGVISDLIRKHHGRVIDTPGDNLLAEFSSVVEALRSGWDIQQAVASKNSEMPSDRRMKFRIGIHLGDVIEEGQAIYGDGVNVAARLESLAEAGGISISGAAFDQVKNKLPYNFEYQGEQQVKNIKDPVRIYRVIMDPAESITTQSPPKRVLNTAARVFLWVAASAVLCSGLVYWGMLHIRALNDHPTAVNPVGQQPEEASIAVLPFRNISGDPEQEYFSDGMARDIITDLSKFHNLMVISSNTTFLYKEKPVAAQAVGSDLGVRYITEGSVQKAGDKVRINVQLIDASSGTHVWAERYERAYDDIFSLQNDIVQSIVSRLAVRILKIEQSRAMRKQPQNMEAYDYLLRGQELYHHYTRASNNRAGQMFAGAIKLDANYAAAYAGLGWVYQAKAAYGWTAFPDKALESAYKYGRKALELDINDASAHSLLCGVYAFQNQYDRAIAEAEQAIGLNPNDAVSYHELGWVLLWSGRVDKAIEALEKSLRLDSTSPLNGWWHLGMAYYLKGRYDDAVKILEEGAVKKPSFAGHYLGLAASYARMGRYEKAARAASELRRLDPFFKVDSFGTGFHVLADREAIMEGLRMAGLK